MPESPPSRAASRASSKTMTAHRRRTRPRPPSVPLQRQVSHPHIAGSFHSSAPKPPAVMARRRSIEPLGRIDVRVLVLIVLLRADQVHRGLLGTGRAAVDAHVPADVVPVRDRVARPSSSATRRLRRGASRPRRRRGAAPSVSSAGAAVERLGRARSPAPPRPAARVERLAGARLTRQRSRRSARRRDAARAG